MMGRAQSTEVTLAAGSETPRRGNAPNEGGKITGQAPKPVRERMWMDGEALDGAKAKRTAAAYTEWCARQAKERKWAHAQVGQDLEPRSQATYRRGENGGQRQREPKPPKEEAEKKKNSK